MLSNLKKVFQTMLAPFQRHIITALQTMQTSLLWNNFTPKINITSSYGRTLLTK